MGEPLAVGLGLAGLGVLALGISACNTYNGGLVGPSQGGSDSGVAGFSIGGTGFGGSVDTGGSGGDGGASIVTGGTANTAGGSDAGAPAGGTDAAGATSGGSGGGAGGGSGGAAGHGGASGATAGGGSGGAIATGGSGGGGAGTVGGPPWGGAGGTPGLDMIDDFEDLDAQILVVPPRTGYWYVFNDGTTTGVQSPLTIAALPSVPATDVRAGSGLHMTAQGFTKAGSFGAGVGADFVNHGVLPKIAYNVAAYRGIQFYAKVAASTQTSVKLLIPTTFSDADGVKCSGTGTSQCGDHLYQKFTVKTTWDVYQCDFTKLVQQGFGLKQATFDPTTVYSVQFTLPNTATLTADIWIDDVAFLVK